MIDLCMYNGLDCIQILELRISDRDESEPITAELARPNAIRPFSRVALCLLKAFHRQATTVSTPKTADTHETAHLSKTTPY